MSCYHPIKAFRTTSGVSFSELRRDNHMGDIQLPCGWCLGCRRRRASDWTVRVMHEAQSHERACFLTLTYGESKAPPLFSLCYEDVQKFLKRVRFHKGPARFFVCGEYGPIGKRPHYHMCLFGADFREDRVEWKKSSSGFMCYRSAEAERLWTHGSVTVQDLTPETASYCAKYILKKPLGKEHAKGYPVIDEDGVIVGYREREFAHMSLKPAIGATWFKKYYKDVACGDSAIVENRELQTPRYYDRLFRRMKSGVDMDDIEWKRYKRAVAQAWNNSPQRLAVREEIAQWKEAQKLRVLED